LVAAVRVTRQYRQGSVSTRRVLSDSAILRGVRRELSSVRRSSEREGWSHDLAGRLLGALRVAGTIALQRHPSQIVGNSTTDKHEGQLLMRGGWLRGKRVFVSGSATTDVIARELSSGDGSASRREALETLRAGFGTLTATQFGRDGKLDEVALTETLRA